MHFAFVHWLFIRYLELKEAGVNCGVKVFPRIDKLDTDTGELQLIVCRVCDNASGNGCLAFHS